MGRLKEAMLDDRPYPATPGYKAPGTSQEAATVTRSRQGDLQIAVLESIRKAGARGLTADEAAEAINKTVHAIRPRVTELAQDGKIEKTGERRKNASGLGANVWRVKP